MIYTVQDLQHNNGVLESMDKEYTEFVGENHAVTSSARGWLYPETILQARLQPDHVVLDVGCASSYFGVYIADKVSKVYGIDDIETYAFTTYTIAWMESLRDFPAYHNGDFVLLFSNAAKLPFPDNFFDRVFTFSAMEHFLGGDDTLCVTEIARVLKPGGMFLGSVDYNPATEYPTGDEWARVYTLESLWRRIITPSGLSMTGEDYEAPVPIPESVDYIAQDVFFMLRKD